MTATAALAIVSSDRSVALSPARRALADHLDAVSAAKSDFDRARRPVERLQEQLAVATTQLAAAEADLAAIDAKHAASLRNQAESDGPIRLRKPPESEKAEATLDSARRTCNAVRAALAECDASAGDAGAALRNVKASTDQFIQAVFAEEYRAAVDRLARAAAEHEAAMTEADAIREAIFQHARGLQHTAPDQAQPWFVAANQMVSAPKLPPPAQPDYRSATARWSAALARLATDPSARG